MKKVFVLNEMLKAKKFILLSLITLIITITNMKNIYAQSDSLINEKVKLLVAQLII